MFTAFHSGLGDVSLVDVNSKKKRCTLFASLKPVTGVVVAVLFVLTSRKHNIGEIFK